MRTDPAPSGDSDVSEPIAPRPVEAGGEAGSAGRRRSNPWLVAFLLVIAVGSGVLTWWESRPKPPEGPPRAYYTTDEGRTFFIDEAEKLPPFDHGGKPAVRARLFSCDGGKTRFAGYLEKLPDEAFTTLSAEGKDPSAMDDDDIAERFGWLVKRPGDPQWINQKVDRAGYDRVTQVKCPEGGPLLSILPRPDE